MTVEVAARPATEADTPEVLRLLGLTLDAVAGQRGGDAWLATEAPPEPFAPFVQAALADVGALLALGLIDDVPVGLVHARVDRWRDGRAVAVVHQLFVEEAARELGVGEALLDTAIGFARARGCFAIESLALPGDRDLKNLFERFGLVARAIVVHKDLT